MADKGGGVWDSITESYQITQGQFWFLFRLYFCELGIVMAGVLCFGVGFLFAFMLYTFMNVQVYNWLQEDVAARIGNVLAPDPSTGEPPELAEQNRPSNPDESGNPPTNPQA